MDLVDHAKAVEDRINRRLLSMIREAEKEFRGAEFEFAPHFNSGAMVRRRLELVSQHLTAGTDWAFAEIERYSTKSKFARVVHAYFLQDALTRLLIGLVDASHLLSGPRLPQATAALVQRELGTMRGSLALDLKQFQQGVWRAREQQPGVAAPQNVVNVGRDFHGGVRLGGEYNQQDVSFTVVDWSAVRDISAKLAEAVSTAEMPADARNEIQADVDTISAQLRKASPGEAAIREAAKSLRNVVEGMVGSAVLAAPHIAVLVGQLWSALGLR